MQVTCSFEFGVIAYRAPSEVVSSHEDLFVDPEGIENAALWSRAGSGDAVAHLLLDGKVVASTYDLMQDLGSEMADSGWPTYGSIDAAFVVELDQAEAQRFTAELHIDDYVFPAERIRVWTD